MASTQAKAVRRADVLQRLSVHTGTEQADLNAHGRGDPEMALIITLERIADALDARPVTDDLRAAILAADDDELTALPGVGVKSLDAMRAWAAGEAEADEPDPVASSKAKSK